MTGDGVAAGNSVIFAVSARADAAVTSLTCSDSAGNPYSIDVSITNPRDRLAVLSSHDVDPLAAGTTISCTAAAHEALSVRLVAVEVAGLAGDPLDATSSNQAAATPAWTSGAATTTQPDELIAAAERLPDRGLPLRCDRRLHQQGQLHLLPGTVGGGDLRPEATALAEDRLLGVGFATFIENAPRPADFAGKVGFDLPSETAWARLEPTGDLTVHTWQVPHGQSHETTLAQVSADELGLPIERVRLVHGDSDNTPFNTISTGGSRSAMMAHGATRGATRVIRDQVLQIAATMLEADVADLELVDAAVQVRGVPARAIPLADVARAAWFAPSSLPEGMGHGLQATFDFRVPADGGWTSATHACVVEIDPETGRVDVERYLVVEDCGQMINPAVVDGQIRGGAAQGLASVLHERLVYDDDGQLLTSTFADYGVPAACDLPAIEVHHLHSSPRHETDYRGVGEGGMIGAPAAVTNAVADALAQIGVALGDADLSPEQMQQRCQQGGTTRR